MAPKTASWFPLPRRRYRGFLEVRRDECLSAAVIISKKRYLYPLFLVSTPHFVSTKGVDLRGNKNGSRDVIKKDGGTRKRAGEGDFGLSRSIGSGR